MGRRQEEGIGQEVELSLSRPIAAEYLYLSRGQAFSVDVSYYYQGPPQVLTFELKMKQGLFGTEYLCGTPTASVTGATAWTQKTGKPSYTVPSGVKLGSQDIRMRITTADGKEEYSSWLADCIYIS